MTKASVSKHPEMVELYMCGKTKSEVASTFGIHRTRVHQILKALGALDRDSERGELAEITDRHLALRAKTVRERWNLSLNEYDEHVAMHGSSGTPDSPMRRYIEQRKQAARRGIGWEFDFSTWWAKWQESGLWAERGHGSGYVMARNNDGDTPYSPTTIYFCTGGQNTKDAFVNIPMSKRNRFKRGVGCGRGYTVNPKGGPNPYNVALRGKYLGSFPTPELARAAYLAAAEEYKRTQP